MYIIHDIDFNIKDTKNIKYIYILIYMDVIQDITVIEKDLEKVNEDCNKINCSAVYQAIEDTIKLIIDCIACCFKFCKPKKE
jgi:actin-like ATPase involved in cell morphogenesis